MKNLENFHYTDLWVQSKGYLIVSLCLVMFRGYVPKVLFSCLKYFRFNTILILNVFALFRGKVDHHAPHLQKRNWPVDVVQIHAVTIRTGPAKG